MKKKLSLDGKKRITMGKLISKEVTFFEVEKKSDGTIILYPKTDVAQLESEIYTNKKNYKILKSSLKDFRKSLTTKLNSQFWEGL